MKKLNDNEAVYWLLMQVMFQAKHRIHQIAEGHDLTVMQANTLTMLKADEPMQMRLLSDYFMCDASNVTGIADRLEARGLIKRQDLPGDRRIKLIALTSEGEATRLNPVLDEDERQTLRDLLEKILSAQPASK